MASNEIKIKVIRSRIPKMLLIKSGVVVRNSLLGKILLRGGG